MLISSGKRSERVFQKSAKALMFIFEWFFKSKVLFFLILREVSFQIYLQTRDLYREARRPRRASNFIGIEVTFVLIQKFFLRFVFVGKTQRVVIKESQLYKLPLLLFLILVFLYSKMIVFISFLSLVFGSLLQKLRRPLILKEAQFWLK